jgi:hypothetical protein
MDHYLREVEALLVRAAEIGGKLDGEVAILETAAKATRDVLSSAVKDTEADELLKRVRALTTVERQRFLAQRGRADTPIRKEEEVCSLLSEDVETIREVAHLSQHFPQWHASMRAEAVEIIDRALREGLHAPEGRKKLLALGVNTGAKAGRCKNS